TPSLPYSHPGRVLLQGGGDAFSCRSTASVRTESNQYTEPAPFAPGAGAPTGGVTRSVVGAPPRCEPSQTNTPSPPIRTRGGCSYRVEVTRSVVGAPPRCEAKSDQYTEPAHSHPGRVHLPALRGTEKAPPSLDATAFDMAQRTGLDPATP